MNNKRKSKYDYSEGQKELNRAFKMQDIELKKLEECSQQLSSSITENEKQIAKMGLDVEELKSREEQLRSQALTMAKDLGINLPDHLTRPVDLKVEKADIDNSPYLTDEKISFNDIPSWDEIMEKTDEIVPEEVVLEDLLSAKEFQYCIEDIERINNEFLKKTKLSKVDIAFLMVATALQTARWIIIQQILGDLGETINEDNRIHNKQGDKQKKKDIHDWHEKHNGRENVKSQNDYPTWKDILFGQYKRIDGNGTSAGVCPYDAQSNAPAGFDDGGKGNHRVHTLGHDPILGWIFGTANLMTCTISLSKKFNFATYDVEYPGGRFSDVPTSMTKMFHDVFQSTKEDKFRLAAALFAQYAHLKSDVFTKRGLPAPLLDAFSEELTGKLYAEQYDSLCLLDDLKIVGSQAAFSIIINMIIGFVHGLFYNKEKDGRREHYEVRTRKILLYSNAISSSINLAYVGINACTGNEGEALKKLDLGGLLVTLWRLFSDVRFITRIKEQYLNEELDKVTKCAIAELDAMFE